MKWWGLLSGALWSQKISFIGGGEVGYLEGEQSVGEKVVGTLAFMALKLSPDSAMRARILH